MKQKFDQVIRSYGFQINDNDKCVYVKQFDDNGCAILCLYLDDILIFGSNMHLINDVKFLWEVFYTKDNWCPSCMWCVRVFFLIDKC